jgi:hypothetical protein
VRVSRCYEPFRPHRAAVGSPSREGHRRSTRYVFQVPTDSHSATAKLPGTMLDPGERENARLSARRDPSLARGLKDSIFARELSRAGCTIRLPSTASSEVLRFAPLGALGARYAAWRARGTAPGGRSAPGAIPGLVDRALTRPYPRCSERERRTISSPPYGKGRSGALRSEMARETGVRRRRAVGWKQLAPER